MMGILKSVLPVLLLLSGSAALADLSAEQLGVLDKLTENCSANGSGASSYKYKEHNPAEILKDRVESSCRDTQYSTSKENAVAMAIIESRNKGGPGIECIYEYLSKEERKIYRDLIRDEANIAVYTTLYGDSSNSEGCYYSIIKIFRNDGIAIDIEFNETD